MTLTPTHIIWVGKIILSSRRIVIRDKKIKLKATHQEFNSNKRRGHLSMICLLNTSPKSRSHSRINKPLSKNLEHYVGQLTATLASKTKDSLSSDREKNLWERVLTVEVANCASFETPSFKPTISVRAYVLHISFSQRLGRQSKEEHVQAIIKMSRVQLLVIGTRRKDIENNQVSTKGEEHVEQSEESEMNR